MSLPPLIEAMGLILLRLLVAILCGAALGWEREKQKKPAGLRTYMMVSLGAATFTLITLEMYRLAEPNADTRLDPLRVVEGIIGGIGFLGAGSIIRARGSVEGITTAAGIWVSGAIGVACGAGLYPIAILSTILALIILALVTSAEKRIAVQSREKPRDEDKREG